MRERAALGQAPYAQVDFAPSTAYLSYVAWSGKGNETLLKKFQLPDKLG